MKPSSQVLEGGPEIKPRNGAAVGLEERQKQLELVELLESWMADESGDDERLWPLVKAGLEENRTSGRALFSE